MDEASIAQQLAATIPQTLEVTQPAAITAPELTGFGSAAIELDEMTQFKLHELMDVKYDSRDNEARERLQYIYKALSQGLDNPDYLSVAAKIRETMRVAGITHSDKKLYKLYQFLRLSNVMRDTGKEMELLRDA